MQALGVILCFSCLFIVGIWAISVGPSTLGFLLRTKLSLSLSNARTIWMTRGGMLLARPFCFGPETPTTSVGDEIIVPLSSDPI